MRIAHLAPMPYESNGIAHYASHFGAALQACGATVTLPLAAV